MILLTRIVVNGWLELGLELVRVRVRVRVYTFTPSSLPPSEL